MVKDFENSGYWAIILGGSSGLGLASAKKLAAHGMNICIVHRDSRTEMETIAVQFEEIKAFGVQVATYNFDLLALDKIKVMLLDVKEKMGPAAKVRCLLHSIAKGNLKPMAAAEESILSTDDFRITIQNMAFSLYEWVRIIFDEKLFALDARIISFTSEGSKKALENYAAVSAAKAALEAISRSIALEFAPFGIRSNCIQAGVTDTKSLQMIPGSASIIEHSLKRNPFGRLTLPEDVANVAYLLCKDEAAWINGTIIPVDGGEQIH